LFTADSCIGCHSLTGAAGAGPPLNGVAGATTKPDDVRALVAFLKSERRQG
jgi:mono/diheme cytochrome c family protein